MYCMEFFYFTTKEFANLSVCGDSRRYRCYAVFGSHPDYITHPPTAAPPTLSFSFIYLFILNRNKNRLVLLENGRCSLKTQILGVSRTSPSRSTDRIT